MTAISIPQALDAGVITLLFAASAFAMVAAGVVMRRLRFRLAVLRIILISTLLSWYAHFWATITYCAGWGCSEADVVPAAGLAVFSYVSPSAVLALLAFFIWCVGRRPQTAPLFPVLASIIELSALRLLERNAPPDYFYMNAAADRWLIVSSLAAALFLASYSWLSHPPFAAET